MSDNTEEYNRYTQIAKERPAKVEKQKVTSWQLVFQKSKTAYDKLASGGYALCQYYKKNYPKDKRYRIIPYDGK